MLLRTRRRRLLGKRMFRPSVELLECRQLLASDLTFAEPLMFDVASNPEHILVADLNADGHADLVTANYQHSNVSVLLGKGDGSFESEAHYRTGIGPVHAAAADFDGDNILDLVVANMEGASVSVLLGLGDGEFDFSIDFSAGVFPESVATGDFDGDGFLDLVVAHSGTPTDPGGVSILMGRSEGNFVAAVEYFAELRPEDVEVGDFNHDGKPDLALANGFIFSNDNDVAVLLGAGDGTFPTIDRYAAGAQPGEVLVADFNRDGHLDIVAFNSSSSDVSVLRGAGDGTFSPTVNYGVTGGGWSVSLAAGDLNGDDLADLIASGGTDVISVLINAGDGTFHPAQTLRAGYSVQSVATGDFNEDGRVDIAAVTQDTDDALILMNTVAGDANRDGAFDQQDIVSVLQAGEYLTGQPATWSEGDWNGDGNFDQLDIVAAMQTGAYLAG